MKHLLFLLALSMISWNCARNPITGKRELAISEDKEKAMGAAYDPQIVSSMGTYEDKGLNDLLNRVGKEMAKTSHRPDLNWTFRIVDSDVVNAFAVPGGYVYFTRGILAHFNNEAEFAGVLGHEIGHVTARHSAQQIRQQQLAQVGLIAGVIASDAVRQNFESINQGMQLLFLKNGRDAESESDALGVEYSSEIGYDASQMAGFFKTIDRLQKRSGQEIPDFLSTHPDPLNREANVRALAKEWQAKLPGNQDKVNRDGYLALIEGLLYGEDPNQGYVEKGKFYHPQLKFVFDVPTNWRLLNSPQQVQIAAPDQDAAITFTLAQGNSPEAAAQTWLQQNQLQASRGGATTVNGLQAYQIEGVAGDPQQQQQELAWTSTFISYGSTIYVFTGITLINQTKKYARVFGTTSTSFKALTDPTYLNRQPERIRIKTVPSNQTLKAFLTSQGTPAARLEELSILNGLALETLIKAGTKIKTVGK